MAKNTTRITFAKARIIKNEDGGFNIIEETKEGEFHYDLTEILDRFAGVEGINISITSDTEVDPID